MRDLSLHTSRILIVAGEENTGRLLQGMLRYAGHPHTLLATDVRDLLSLAAEFRPDLVVLDVSAPHLDALAVLPRLREAVPGGGHLPVLLYGDLDPATKTRALSRGAYDFLPGSFDQADLTARVRNLLTARRLYDQLMVQTRFIEEKFGERSRQLEETQIEILERLAMAVERRDDETGEHARRVGQNAALLARELGMGEEEVELIRRAAQLHDVGKVAIPDTILLKQGRLSAEEYELMKSHTEIGARLLGESRAPLLNLAEQIALTHHERWDGRGYPMALKRWTIPMAGRIVAVVDAFDALTHERPYRPGMSIYEAVEELDRLRGSQFDPEAVDAFRRVLEREGYIRRRQPA